MKYCRRLLEKKVKAQSGFFKVLLLTGARQTGKSTLLQHLFPEYKYVLLDPLTDEWGARSNPDIFLDNFPSPCIIDEIQYAPMLLPAIKKRVDSQEASGQYILTGSQSLQAMANVSESLAGRVGILQLEGMTLHEIEERQSHTNDWLNTILGSEKNIDLPQFETPERNISSLIWRGFMPGLLDAPANMVGPFHKSYITTYIERDIRTLANIENLSDFHRFVQLCASLSGSEINFAHLGRETGLHAVTVRKWLSVLGQSYLWRELPPYFGNVIKRITKKPVGIFGDTGIICSLLGISIPEAIPGHRNAGALFETFVINSVIRHCATLDTEPNYYHWRTGAGAEVDLVLERDGMLLPIEIKFSRTLSGSDTRGLQAFQNTYPEVAKTGIIFYGGTMARKVSERVIALPFGIL